MTRVEATGPGAESTERDLALSLVRDDVPLRLLRRVGLVPSSGLGVGRRAVFFALLAWLPIAIWAVAAGRALPGGTTEPLLEHFGVHVRCLLAIPLLIVAQGMAHRTTTLLLPWFLRSGVIAADRAPQLREVVRGAARLRNSVLPWIAIAGIAIAWSAVGPVAHDADEVSWAVTNAVPATGFGGWWFLYVARPIYVILALAWIWRVILLTLIFRGATKVGLDLVPTHPDRVGGLGFVERFATIFGPVAFVFSAVIASQWAHQGMFHDLAVGTLKAPAAAFLVVALIVFLAPLAVFAGPLSAARKRAELEYGALSGRHGAGVRRRWILGERIDDDLLSAPEIGPVADTAALYESVTRMRPLPIGKRALIAIALPALVPILLVFAIKVPLAQILGKLLKGLV